MRTPSFEAVRLIAAAGNEIPTHKEPGRITLHRIEGRAELGLPDASAELLDGMRTDRAVLDTRIAALDREFIETHEPGRRAAAGNDPGSARSTPWR